MLGVVLALKHTVKGRLCLLADPMGWLALNPQAPALRKLPPAAEQATALQMDHSGFSLVAPGPPPL